MRNRLLTIATLFFLTSAAARAVPAYPAKKTITLADGTTATLTLRGDENFSFYTTDDGQPWIRSARGTFEQIDRHAVDSIWGTRLRERNRQRMEQHARKAAPRKATTTGKRRGLVLLVAFSDQDFVVKDPQTTYKNYFSKQGYNEYGMSGSVRDYFLDQSYGQLDIDFDIVGPLKLDRPMAYYGAPTESSNDAKPAQMIYDACIKADEAGVNFADYDWSGQGRLEEVFVIYAGYGQNYGADPNTIWPHEWRLRYGVGSALQLDNTIIDTYACSCELYGTEASGTILDGIGAACHEFTHCLGIPDFYDTGYSGGFGTGEWDVMCSGSYNNASRTPAGYTSYERWFAGWMEPTELKAQATVTGMKALQDAPEAYVLYNEGNRNEYYLLENRQPTKWDSKIGNGAHGLLVLHVDYDKQVWSDNAVNTSTSRQRMTIVPADNRLTSSSLAGDPFPGTSGNTELTNYSTPAATLYSNNADGTRLMGKPIDNIKEENGLISFTACRPEMGIPILDPKRVTTTGNSFTVAWDAVAGATSYELELTETPAASHDLAQSLMLEEDFGKCYSKSNGFTDLSAQLSKYTTVSGWAGSKLYTSPNNLLIGTSAATGYVVSPTFNVPASGEITVVVGAKLFADSAALSGSIRLITDAGNEDHSFSLTSDGRYVVHLDTRASRFRIGVYPGSRMYMDYMAIYEGHFTEEELGIAAAPAKAPAKRTPRRISTTSYTTTSTSFTFAGLNTTSKYAYRVRALSAETRSLWSDEQEFIFPATGISSATVKPDDGQQPIFDLNGRCIGTDASRLMPGIYVRNGKKIVIR